MASVTIRRLLAAVLSLAVLFLTAASSAQAGSPFEPGGGLPDVGFELAAVVPSGFEESVAFSGLDDPIAVRFAADGRVFVAEKGGVIKVFDNLNDPTAVDLRRPQHERSPLLGPRPARPGARPAVHDRPAVRVRALHARRRDRRHGAAVGRRLPHAAGRHRRWVRRQRPALEAQRGGTEQVLIEDWCQQYPSHSIGTLAFGADGALYVRRRRRRELRLRRLRRRTAIPSTPAGTRRAAWGAA